MGHRPRRSRRCPRRLKRPELWIRDSVDDVWEWANISPVSVTGRIGRTAIPIFVHIADERDAKSILRNGLALPKNRLREFENARRKWGVFALPVVEDFMLSHQWVRELKRRGHRLAVGVYFRLPDDQPVWAGMFNGDKEQITAAEAASRLRTQQLLGYEVVIPRGIAASEVVSVRPLPHVGWRYFPESKGSPPRCLCKYCNRGDIKSRKMRDRLDPDHQYA